MAERNEGAIAAPDRPYRGRVGGSSLEQEQVRGELRVEAWLVGLPQENKFKGEQGLGWMPGHNHKTFSTILRTGVDTTKENESWRTQQRRTIIQQETMPAPDRPYRSRVGGVPHRGARHHRARVCERNQSMFRYVQRNTKDK